VRWTVSLKIDSARTVETRRRREGLSRSAMVDRMITESERERFKRELQEETRAYYSRPRTADEEALSLALHEIAKRTLAASDIAEDEW